MKEVMMNLFSHCETVEEDGYYTMSVSLGLFARIKQAVVRSLRK